MNTTPTQQYTRPEGELLAGCIESAYMFGGRDRASIVDALERYIAAQKSRIEMIRRRSSVARLSMLPTLARIDRLASASNYANQAESNQRRARRVIKKMKAL